ncbi:MAG TPA: thioredoxin domain-containing protein [Candidatus Binatia bacterium]|nr:thioredoxin domain-containing protein [Candidatus Binatia bacterium]
MNIFRVLLGLLFAAAAARAQDVSVGSGGHAAAPADSVAQAAPAAGAAGSVGSRVEAYLRNLYALGPTFTIKVGPPQPTAIPGLRSVEVEIATQGQNNQGTMYVSEDGRYLVQGDLSDMDADPFVALRADMDLSSAPSRGPAGAKVVVVEYADLQCPSCRRLSEVIRSLVPDYPQVRFVFREFPLTQIHVWSLTAALGGRCIYHKNPAAFWTYAEYIFDHQDQISAGNVWETVVAQGVAAGYDADTFKACLVDPAMKAEIDKSTAEGIKLKVANTPTVFVNGRRLVGGEREGLVQYIDFELARLSAHSRPAKTSTPK